MKDNTLKELIELLENVKEHIIKFEKLIIMPNQDEKTEEKDKK